MSRARIESARLGLGDFLNALFERGLELALGGAAIINGRLASVAAAPFLRSCLAILSPSAQVWALVLYGFGALQITVVLASILKPDLKGLRAFTSALGMALYLAITVAILTSSEPHQVAERYAWGACWFGLCAVVLGARALADVQKRGALKRG